MNGFHQLTHVINKVPTQLFSTKIKYFSLDLGNIIFKYDYLCGRRSHKKTYSYSPYLYSVGILWHISNGVLAR